MLSAIRVAVDGGSSKERGAAYDAFLALDEKALDLLIALLQDDALSCEYAHSAMTLLIRLGREDRDRDSVWHLPRGPVEGRPLSPHADRIVDAMVSYAAKHPDQDLPIGRLDLILPLERLPEVIDWAESSSGKRQRDFIVVFTRLTHTSFPIIPQGFCGNSSPASIEGAIREGEQEQSKSPQRMRAWWEENGQRPYSAWVVDELRRKIGREKDSREWMLKQYEGDERMQAVYIRQLPHWSKIDPSTQTLGGYAFDPLLQEFSDSPDWLRPYVLGLISLCDYPAKLGYVAGFLSDSNDHLKSAAVEVLGRLNAKEYAPRIRRVLEETDDALLQQVTIDALVLIRDPDAMEAAAQFITSPDRFVRSAANKAISLLLEVDAKRVERLARSHPDSGVRAELSRILTKWRAGRSVRAARSDEASPENRIRRVEALLRSQDPQLRQEGIRLVDQYDLVELIPVCLDLLEDSDAFTRRSLVKLITGKGIPNLNVANAENLLGYSLSLDQRMAIYCCARFGDEALPLVRKVAFQWRDPDKGDGNRAGRPSLQLLQILRDSGEPDLDEKIVKLLRRVPKDDSLQWYSQLTDTLGAKAAAEVVDELLDHGSAARAAIAARCIQRHGLTDHADRLVRFAQAADRPSMPAIDTLIGLEHPEAWPSAVCLLNSRVLNERAHGLGMPSSSVAYVFGQRLSGIKHTHRLEMHEMLKAELAGDMRRWVVVSLTAALARAPEATDQEMLQAIARKEVAPRAAQILAAVALSHLGDSSCLPALRRLLRDCLETDCGRRPVPCEPSEFQFNRGLKVERLRAELYPAYRSFLDRRTDLFGHSLSGGSPDETSVVSALCRLGDDSMTPEVLYALVSDQGGWNHHGYALLLEMKGFEGYRRARERAAHVDPAMMDRWTRVPRLFVGLDFSHDEALELLTYKKLNLFDESLLILKHDLRDAADPLVELLGKCTEVRAPYRATILDILCRFGDRRGLDLAVDDPLLFMEVARYLADPPVPVVEPMGFRFNRIQDALTLIDWYRAHRSAFVWDGSVHKFRLPRKGAAG